MSRKNTISRKTSCISLANNRLMDVIQLALTWVGWSNGEKLASTCVQIWSRPKWAQVNASARKPWPSEVASWPKSSTCVNLRQLASTCVSVWPGLYSVSNKWSKVDNMVTHFANEQSSVNKANNFKFDWYTHNYALKPYGVLRVGYTKVVLFGGIKWVLNPFFDYSRILIYLAVF